MWRLDPRRWCEGGEAEVDFGSGGVMAVSTRFSLIQTLERTVRVRGSWDNFQKSVRMKPQASRNLRAVYEAEVFLRPGKYLFRYYVDGRPCLAKLKDVEEVEGTQFSVLVVAPTVNVDERIGQSSISVADFP